MRIWVLRHGEAERQTQYDPDRILTARGTEDAKNAGLVLSKFVSNTLQIFASPYRRAQQTAQAAALALPHQNISTVDWLTPDIDPRIVLCSLEQLPQNDFLLVSHQPLVSALIGVLIDGDYLAGPPMSPASLAELELTTVGVGCATLISLRHAPDFHKAAI
ncbi:MAG: phosphohistidine phosphatase SixA [Spongiibacteraceae bacterium]